MDDTRPIPDQPPRSDVSAMVGLIGVAALLGWVAFARKWPAIATTFKLPTPPVKLDGPLAAMTGLVVVALPMVLWSLWVEKVHLRPSTGIDWSLRRARRAPWSITLTKAAGLWATWAILAALYCLGRWYWTDGYQLTMRYFAVAGVIMVAATLPYLRWLDKVMVEPRDGAWHMGALVTLQRGWSTHEVARHARAWLIKGFFGAFMVTILPGNFGNVVNPDLSEALKSPAGTASLLINLLFLIDVMVGTVGYIVTFRPLDAHIRSGNPFLGGWVAALLCYPPFVWGVLGNGMVLGYEHGTPGWAHWMEARPALAWGWGALLVALTGVYAWATFAFGLRFSNLTYRGVITNGPYRFTRHPAYLAKNLFWWASVLPFLVDNGSTVDAVRNCFFLLCVNGIYYWRARTEEAHMLAEDPRYGEYHAWMARHGLITAPLTRLLARLDPRRRAAPAV